EQGRLVICTDEKTGMQILERKYPTQPIEPGKPEKREHEYIRHGTRVLIASFVVPTGQVVWNLGPTRTSADFAAHLAHVVTQLPKMKRYDWVVDNLNTHWSLDVCRVVAQWCKVPQIPPDLVVKSQVLDIVGFTLLLMQEKNLVHTSPGPRRSRFEPLSLSAGYWFTTKSAGMWEIPGARNTARLTSQAGSRGGQWESRRRWWTVALCVGPAGDVFHAIAGPRHGAERPYRPAAAASGLFPSVNSPRGTTTRCAGKLQRSRRVLSGGIQEGRGPPHASHTSPRARPHVVCPGHVGQQSL